VFPRTIKNVNTWYFHTKTSTPIDCLSTYFYRSLVRKTVCFGLYIDKTCVRDIFSDSPLNTDTRIIQTLWHVPLVSVLTGFHCIFNFPCLPSSFSKIFQAILHIVQFFKWYFCFRVPKIYSSTKQTEANLPSHIFNVCRFLCINGSWVTLSLVHSFIISEISWFALLIG